MILVTGATGRVGSQVVRALARAGHPVRAFVRTGSEYFWLNDTGCSYRFGDLRDGGSVRRALQGVDRIVVCSGVTRERRGSSHRRVTFTAHAELWETARAAGVGRAVYVSALGAERLGIPWFTARLGAEEALRASGLDHVVLRPAPLTRTYVEFVHGSAGRPVIPAPGTNRVTPVATRDVALLAVAALDLPGVSGQVLELGGPTLLTGRQALGEAAAALDLELSPRHVPGLTALSAGGGRRRRNHQRLLQAWLGVDLVATAEELEHAGIRPTPLADALAADVAELLPRQSPDARTRLSIPRRFAAAAYSPGPMPFADLPDGPLTHD